SSAASRVCSQTKSSRVSSPLWVWQPLSLKSRLSRPRKQRRERNEKHQTPNTKHQRSSKSQTPSVTSNVSVGFWRLEFLWCLVFGIWCFWPPMNSHLLILEIAVLVLGVSLLLLDLWTPTEQKRVLGYGAALALLVILVYSFKLDVPEIQYAFGQSYVLDSLALFFKRFFLLATIIVLIIAVEFADRIESSISEYYSLILFAISGMMFAASANDFTMLFVSLELITVTFYVLTSFQRRRLSSLE